MIKNQLNEEGEEIGEEEEVGIDWDHFYGEMIKNQLKDEY